MSCEVTHRDRIKLGGSDENLHREETGRWAPTEATNKPRLGITVYQSTQVKDGECKQEALETVKGQGLLQ